MPDWTDGTRDDGLVPRLTPALSLAALEPFGVGGYRHCYVHPTDENLCVKVVARDDATCRIHQKFDIDSYVFLRKRGAEALFDRIPEVKGVVNTDLGVGIVMQLCRDADGSVSRSLVELVRDRGLTPSLAVAIGELKCWLRTHRLFTQDTGPHNVIAVHRDKSDWKLMIAEGWVHRYWHLIDWCPGAVIDHMIERQIAKFDRRLSYVVSHLLRS